MVDLVELDCFGKSYTEICWCRHFNRVSKSDVLPWRYCTKRSRQNLGIIGPV